MIEEMVLKLFSRFWRSGFARNALTLQAGGFVGNIIQALAGILIARWLQPELFGIYTLAFSLAGLISFFLGVGAQEAVTTVIGRAYAQNDQPKVEEALAFLFKINLVAGLIVLSISFLAPWLAEMFYGQAVIGWFALLIIGGVIISTLLFSPTSLALQITGQIRSLAGLVLSDQAWRYGLALLFIWLGYGVRGGVLGHLGGAMAVGLISWRFWKMLVRRLAWPGLDYLWSIRRRVSIKKHLRFSVWIALDRNVANLYSVLPILLTGVFVSVSEVTFFKLALAYVNFALSLLVPISTLLNVEFPKLQVETDRKTLTTGFIKISLYSLGLSTLLTGGALLVAPWAFRFFYGVNFLPSVSYVYGLLIYGALFGLGVGLGPMWRTLNKVKTSLLINLVVLGAGIPLGLWLVKNFGLWGAVAMVTVWFTVSHLISFLYLANKLQKGKT